MKSVLQITLEEVKQYPQGTIKITGRVIPKCSLTSFSICYADTLANLDASIQNLRQLTL